VAKSDIVSYVSKPVIVLWFIRGTSCWQDWAWCWV